MIQSVAQETRSRRRMANWFPVLTNGSDCNGIQPQTNSNVMTSRHLTNRAPNIQVRKRRHQVKDVNKFANLEFTRLFHLSIYKSDTLPAQCCRRPCIDHTGKLEHTNLAFLI